MTQMMTVTFEVPDDWTMETLADFLGNALDDTPVSVAEIHGEDLIGDDGEEGQGTQA